MISHKGNNFCLTSLKAVVEREAKKRAKARGPYAKENNNSSKDLDKIVYHRAFNPKLCDQRLFGFKVMRHTFFLSEIKDM